MLHESLFKILLIVFCGFAFTGCEDKEVGDPPKNTANTPLTSINSFATENSTGAYDGNQLIEMASLYGDVIDFSNTGCTLNPQISEDGGQSAKIAASGNRDTSTNVTIQYQENCIFQLVTISTASGKAEVTNATMNDIKKQTKLLIFGEFQDKSNIIATKVMIKQLV